MGLETYRQKRDFERTAEPRGRKAGSKGHAFVVQKHAARALHYDFRLELDGVLLSWAVPKGPSLDPKVKRLAMQTEDHPLEYVDFEGIIPKGEYGGGTVIVWDRGHWEPDGDARQMYEAGRLTFELFGEKLHGSFHLVRTGGKAKDAKQRWLLFKRTDSAAQAGSDAEILETRPESVLSGRNIEQVKSDPDRVWSSKPGALNQPPDTAVKNRTSKRQSVRRAASVEAGAMSRPQGAKRAKLLDWIEPQLATLVGAAPAGDEWLHEIKLDGYRLLARIEKGSVALLSRRGHDWTQRLPTLSRDLLQLPIKSGMLDGEVVVLGQDGVSDFQRLQNSLEAGSEAACVYFAFDALFIDGYDLRSLPLLRRKQLLSERFAVMPRAERVRFSDHVRGEGAAFFAQACKLGLEGIIAKRADSGYSSGRSKAWLKIKCLHRQEFVVGGYTDPAGSRGYFGALLLGVHEAGRLVYAGKVGTGFTQQSLKQLAAQMKPLERATPAFDEAPRGPNARGVHWLEPRLVAEVEFAQRTQDGMVRHAAFRGLREDKLQTEVIAERPQRLEPAKQKLKPSLDLSRIELTHPERVLYPEQGITKRDLALYYASVARYMLPHVIERPLMLVRCPEGAEAQCFHQKHPSQGMPRAVERVPIQEKKGPKEHLMIRDVEGLIGLVQMGALEIHTWGCKASAPDCPDQLVFDLDPDVGLPWQRVVDAARKVRSELRGVGLTGFLKTTGGKGLHVVVPVIPQLPWEAAKEFSKDLVARMVRAEPSKYLLTMTKQKRTGKIFLDYLRNGRGSTAVCAFSTRRHTGAPVSIPIDWDELEDGERPQAFETFTLQGLARRLDALASDPWQDFEAARAPIPKSL
jgi:bifunctional non-homologous end joining protein LigD